MSILSQIPALKNAAFFDPDSTSGVWGAKMVMVPRECLKLRRLTIAENYNEVWINSSIYPSAFVKLLLILFSLRTDRDMRLRVFFHGGRFEKIAFLKSKSMRYLAAKLLRRTESRHFLSREQGKGFERTFQGLSWEEYGNFLPPADRPLERLPAGNKIFLFVGRLVREKGIYEILAAFDKLVGATKRNDLAIWLVGEGPEMESLRRQAQLRPEGQVRLWGYAEGESLEDIYRQAWAFLLPSYAEGFPYVVLEAMRAGLPVITTPTGALPNIIEEGKNGFLIQPKDPGALADAMARLPSRPRSG